MVDEPMESVSWDTLIKIKCNYWRKKNPTPSNNPSWPHCVLCYSLLLYKGIMFALSFLIQQC